MSAALNTSDPAARDAREAQGTLTRLESGTYAGGFVCAGCKASVVLTGVKVAAEECPTGEHIRLAASACGRKAGGEIRGAYARVTTPCCSAYSQLDVVVDRGGALPVAVLLARDEVVPRGVAVKNGRKRA